MRERKKNATKKSYTMQIHESLENIACKELSEMGLFELSIHSLMPSDTFRELKRRIEIALNYLTMLEITKAKEVLESLLAAPKPADHTEGKTGKTKRGRK